MPDRRVKLDIEVAEALQIVVISRAAHLVYALLQKVDILSAHPLGQEFGRQALHFHAGSKNLDHIVNRQLGNECPLVGYPTDKSFRLQLKQSFANGGVAHPEFLCKLSFDDPVARSQLS